MSVKDKAEMIVSNIRQDFSALETAVMSALDGHAEAPTVKELLSTMRGKIDNVDISPIVDEAKQEGAGEMANTRGPQPMVVQGSQDPSTSALAMQKDDGSVLAPNSADSTDEAAEVTEGLRTPAANGPGVAQDPAIPDGPKS